MVIKGPKCINKLINTITVSVSFFDEVSFPFLLLLSVDEEDWWRFCLGSRWVRMDDELDFFEFEKDNELLLSA